jgi:hypothetical protein
MSRDLLEPHNGVDPDKFLPHSLYDIRLFDLAERRIASISFFAVDSLRSEEF